MTTGTMWAATGVVLALLANIVLIVRSFTTVGNKVDFLAELQHQAAEDRKEAFSKFNEFHKQHFEHERTAPIHQVAMTKEETLLHIDAAKAQLQHLSNQLSSHAEADMDVFRDIKADLKYLRDRQDEKAS